ncbi:septum formation initiator family protein [Thermoproteota archaeon]
MRIFNTIFFFITVGLCIYICCIGIKNVFRYNKFQLEYHALAKELEVEKQKNLAYIKTLAAMKHPDYWEILAKKRFGYVKKGEVMFLVAPGK